MKVSRAQEDVIHLLDRMRRRMYPETLPALALYWLKTLYHSGYASQDWRALDRLLEHELASGKLSRPDFQSFIAGLRASIQDLLKDRPVRLPANVSDAPAERPKLNPETLVPYIVRLLNEWAPVEVARMLVRDPGQSLAEERGIPVDSFGRALERLLVRERLSAGTLEALLQPKLFSPRHVYSADLEILQDVTLFLLGRTKAPVTSALPATLLYVSPGAHLPNDYAQAVERAFFPSEMEKEELHVPIECDQAVEVLKSHDHVRLTSVVVTMDGRWWQADKLTGGEQNIVVYRPMGVLRMDDWNGHLRVRSPWHEARLNWPGAVSFETKLELFGREWHIAQLEQDAEHTWANLVFGRVLPMNQMDVTALARLRRGRPAAIDLAWAALENGLSAAFTAHSRDPIEQLRHEELIPLGRAIFGLIESSLNRRLRKPQEIANRIRAVGFHAAELEPSLGRVPWRVLPEQVRGILSRPRLYRRVTEDLGPIFDGLPATPGEAFSSGSQSGPFSRLFSRRPSQASPESPRHAA